MGGGRNLSSDLELQEFKDTMIVPARKFREDPNVPRLSLPRSENKMVPPGSPGGDCGCAARERAGVAGPATSALPLSGPASARDGERAGPPARDPLNSVLRLRV